MVSAVRARLHEGLVIPAHPLALTAERRLDEQRQRALTRYYLEAGAGGIAVGVHTTQFAIHDPAIGLLDPVLALASDVTTEHQAAAGRPIVRVAGLVGRTEQAVREAARARDLGYDVALVGLGGQDERTPDDLVSHVGAVADVLPVMGFYLQPAVGGRGLSYAFWRQLMEIELLVAVKIAPFDRYRTLDVVRAVVDSGRATDVALYTGNDDHIVLDLLTPFRVASGDPVHIVGGVLGQWAIWTRRAVRLHAACRRLVTERQPIPAHLLTVAAELTDANGAIFDWAHGFRGCLPGIHEILRRQGLLDGTWCLDPGETLSPGQAEEIDRVLAAYPHLTDDEFVAAGRDRWLA
jgi:dihydrodipicolinate synthase/N-acetylneuraminate lyase